MKNVLSALFLALLLTVASAAFAQDGPIPAAKDSTLQVSAFPGQAWTSIGDSSPVEHGNIQSEIYVEQGVTLFSADKGSITFTPYASVSLGNDTYGYPWNNMVMPFGGAKLNKYFRHGVISVSGGYVYEDRYVGTGQFLSPTLLNGTYNLPTQRGGATGFVNGWFGWQPMADPKSRFPGSAWFEAGNIEPIEHNNVIGMGNVQQGVIAHRFGRVALIPYAELRLVGDTQGNDWENKVAGGGGIKLAAPIHGVYTELGASVRHENRFISGLSATGAYFFFNTSFDWNLFNKKGRQ